MDHAFELQYDFEHVKVNVKVRVELYFGTGNLSCIR